MVAFLISTWVRILTKTFSSSATSSSRFLNSPPFLISWSLLATTSSTSLSAASHSRTERSRSLLVLATSLIFFSISACLRATRPFASVHSHACKTRPTRSSSVHAFCHWRKERFSARRWSSFGVISSARREVISCTRFSFLPIVFWALFLRSSNIRVPAASSTMPRISWGRMLRTWKGEKGGVFFFFGSCR